MTYLVFVGKNEKNKKALVGTVPLSESLFMGMNELPDYLRVLDKLWEEFRYDVEALLTEDSEKPEPMELSATTVKADRDFIMKLITVIGSLDLITREINLDDVGSLLGIYRLLRWYDLEPQFFDGEKLDDVIKKLKSEGYEVIILERFLSDD